MFFSLGSIQFLIYSSTPSILAVKKDIDEVKKDIVKDIDEVKKDIDKVEKKIDGVEEDIRKCNDPDEKAQLRAEEE